MKWIAFVGVLVCEKWLWKEYQKVLYFYEEEENRQALKKNKKDLSCGFVAVINAVRSRDLRKWVFKTGLTHESANALS